VKIIQIMLCFSLLLSACIQATQLSFTRQTQAQQHLFHYQWLDHQNKKQAMSFTLSKTALFDRFRMLKTFNNDFAQKSILRGIKKQLTKQPLSGVQALFKQINGKITIDLNSINEEKLPLAYQQVKKIEQTETENYFKKYYYQYFIDHDNQAGVKMNHIDIANDSVADFKSLKNIILEKVSIKNIRRVTNYVLAFVQNIPYSSLKSRLSSSGAGFNPPAKLLWENQGDCDSKMTLTATLLRSLMPRIEMAMIFIDQHAFIGIAVQPLAGEITVEDQGITYVLAEPTGPALYPLGILAPESALAIEQGRYIVEAYHSDGSIGLSKGL